MEKVGRICFLVGVVVSVVAGFFAHSWIFAGLTVLGLIVGFLNVAATEVQTFLLAAVSLVIISALGSDQISTLPQIGNTVGGIYDALLSFVAPAAIVVALKSIFGVAKQ